MSRLLSVLITVISWNSISMYVIKWYIKCLVHISIVGQFVSRDCGCCAPIVSLHAIFRYRIPCISSGHHSCGAGKVLHSIAYIYSYTDNNQTLHTVFWWQLLTSSNDYAYLACDHFDLWKANGARRADPTHHVETSQDFYHYKEIVLHVLYEEVCVIKDQPVWHYQNIITEVMHPNLMSHVQADCFNEWNLWPIFPQKSSLVV